MSKRVLQEMLWKMNISYPLIHTRHKMVKHTQTCLKWNSKLFMIDDENQFDLLNKSFVVMKFESDIICHHFRIWPVMRQNESKQRLFLKLF